MTLQRPAKTFHSESSYYRIGTY